MISVTGLGIICAIGNNQTEVLDSLKEGRTGLGRMKYLQSSHAELPVGEVKMSDDELKDILGIPVEKIYSRTTLLGSVAIHQALDDAHLTADDLKDKRVVVISGTTVGGMDVTECLYKQMLSDGSMLQYLNRHDCGSSTREMAELCGLDCEVCTISTACSSAINSIILGCEMLKADEVDVVIAGGSEALSKFHLNGFNALHILDTANCRPFDKYRAGLNLGEGAAFVIMHNSGCTIHNESAPNAYIAGYGNRCDAFHQTASSEDGEGAYLAMYDALRMAEITPDNIDYVNAHGTGTPNNDPSESAALRRIFKEKIPPVSSTKGFTGHTTSASGSIETVISILAMQNGFIPVNYGFRQEDENCVRPYTTDTGSHVLNYVLCNAFGFGGNDSSLLLSKVADSSVAQPQRSGTGCVADISSDVTIDTVEQLADCKEYISPKEGRRMGKLMRAATMTSLKALTEAGIDCPDAIITATANGMLETTERFLNDMMENDEETLSPTLFMQTTHNTIGSAIAIRLGCHGYNITYTQGKDSLQWALRDAERLIKNGKAMSVLVGCHDESTPQYQSFMERLGLPAPPMIYSRSIVLKAK